METFSGEQAIGKEEQLRHFAEKIAAFRDEELHEKKESAHFTDPHFNALDLKEEDMEMWERIESGHISREEFKRYQEKLGDEEKENPYSSRRDFLEYLGNMATPLFLGVREEKKQREAA